MAIRDFISSANAGGSSRTEATFAPISIQIPNRAKIRTPVLMERPELTQSLCTCIYLQQPQAASSCVQEGQLQ